MIKKAASLWGVSANEIESSFDPLVSLLIGACASEIEKISNEIDSSQVRVTERLIQLMTPETIYGAKPAHGIVYSEPVEKVLDLTPEHLQYYKKKIRVKNAGQELKNIYFSSVQKFRMVDASITHMICGDKGYVLEGKKKSDFDLSFKSKKKLPFSVLYIGIETSYNKLNLKDVSLYNELLDVYEKELFYHHLKNAEFFFDNQEIKTIAGYSNSEISARDHLNSIFEYKPNKTRNIEGQIKTLYEKHFVSFKSDVLLSNKGSIPDDLSEIVDFEAHEELQKLNWIKIVFPG
ncbi:type VI secretion system baseplate subunit TssF [Aquimarina hainanensis]|uniref:type VI secretion system baseplate subunit TssF n=1 Tax=Aquimarina hainanensis TaxID=1578017 RepID=UPI00360A19F1